MWRGASGPVLLSLGTPKKVYKGVHRGMEKNIESTILFRIFWVAMNWGVGENLCNKPCKIFKTSHSRLRFRATSLSESIRCVV